MSQTVAQFVAHVRSKLGMKESPPGSNNTPFGLEFGWNGVAWCSEYGWCMYHDCGVDLPIKSAGCVQVYDWANMNGFLIPSNQCQPGDSIIRTWQNTDRAHVDPSETHYQIVVGRTGNMLNLIGGNQNDPSGGVVSEDVVMGGDSSVLGGLAWSRLFTTPHNSAPVAPPHDTKLLTKSPSHPDPKPMLQVGSTGGFVKQVQKHVNVIQDGVFGAATKVAVMRFQTAHKLQADGIVGPLTYKAMGIVGV